MPCKKMNVTIYTKTNCPNCTTAKQLLISKGLAYQEVNIDTGDRFANFVANYPDARQMPQIFINDQRVGGLAGLQAALKQLEDKHG
jgi:glutaredoxin 3